MLPSPCTVFVSLTVHITRPMNFCQGRPERSLLKVGGTSRTSPLTPGQSHLRYHNKAPKWSSGLGFRQATTLRDSRGETPVQQWINSQPSPRLAAEVQWEETGGWGVSAWWLRLFLFYSKFVFCRAGCPVYIPLQAKNGHLLTSTWADSPKL